MNAPHTCPPHNWYSGSLGDGPDVTVCTYCGIESPTPYYTDDWLTLYGGDCREVLASLPADSVDCVVTSPPYWGLRDYGTATWEGGDAECDHTRQSEVSRKSSTLVGSTTTQGGTIAWSHTCGKCGATRIDSQLGLERTPEEYVANMVAVFREVRRVLKPSGTCWLNLGDSYAGSSQTGGDGSTSTLTRGGKVQAQYGGESTFGVKRSLGGLKPKDLVGIPWRVAFALQADGWYLRSDIIWSKPNPMPESVTDRPTKSHEYLFLLTKQPRYYFDADAVRETGSGQSAGNRNYKYAGLPGHETKQGIVAVADVEWKQRNIRSVWNIATRPYPGAHFAVFPPELPERCIKAGSSEKGVCPECGAPWERVVEAPKRGAFHDHSKDAEQGNSQDGRARKQAYLATLGERRELGWQPTCDHGIKTYTTGYERRPLPVQPAVILDPFGGSGTVGMVANRLSRRAILIDLNPEYLKQQMTRNSQVPLGLTEGDAA